MGMSIINNLLGAEKRRVVVSTRAALSSRLVETTDLMWSDPGSTPHSFNKTIPAALASASRARIASLT
jgi:hypothetical protein